MEIRTRKNLTHSPVSRWKQQTPSTVRFRSLVNCHTVLGQILNPRVANVPWRAIRKTAYKASFRRREAPSPRKQASYPQKETSFRRKKASYPRKEASFLRKEALFPRKEASFPQKEASYPQKEASFPQKEASYPQKEASYPQKEDVIPAKGSIIPAKGSIIPAKGSIIPAKGGIIPAEGSIIPAKGSVILAEGDVILAEGDVIPTEGDVIPTEGNVIPANGSAIPAEGRVIPAKAGIQAGRGRGHRPVGPSLWIPASAGMTSRNISDNPTLPLNLTYSDIPQQPSPCKSHPTCLSIPSLLPAFATLGSRWCRDMNSRSAGALTWAHRATQRLRKMTRLGQFLAIRSLAATAVTRAKQFGSTEARPFERRWLPVAEFARASFRAVDPRVGRNPPAPTEG